MEERKKAVLVAVYKGTGVQKELCEEHLDELSLLADTYGIDTADKIPCQVRKFDASLFIGVGKLEEIKAKVEELNADMVIFDDEITPGQQRNLETFIGKTVMDRTEVILGVFCPTRPDQRGEAANQGGPGEVPGAQVKTAMDPP